MRYIIAIIYVGDCPIQLFLERKYFGFLQKKAREKTIPWSSTTEFARKMDFLLSYSKGSINLIFNCPSRF